MKPHLRSPNLLARSVFLAALLLAAGGVARAQIGVLHSFEGGPSDGESPFGSVILDGSMLYGMTTWGGAGSGTIFKLGTGGGGYTLLRSFDGGTDGSHPYYSDLALSGSTLYGVTQEGGANGVGTVFKINTDGSSFGVLHTFSDSSSDGKYGGGTPQISGGRLYGMTVQGGANGLGTVYSMGMDGSDFQVVHSFDGSDGQIPFGALTIDGSTAYGMTGAGGSGGGTVFKMNLDGSDFALLHQFAGGATDGNNPYGSLTLLGGKLYGMTITGGAHDDHGVLFEVGTDGSDFSVLHSFGEGEDGMEPRGSLIAVGSELYGMTSTGGSSGGGTVFRIGADGAGYEVVASFDGAVGTGPQGSLVADGSTFYGLTSAGGSGGVGTVFSLDAVPEPTTWAMLGAGALLALALGGRRAR
jgi:uncharacterized repeat protein (TIGR03803 family)